jgi:dTDP-4-amino-4,6-dideoxy-D-galactose acyltransferase
MKITALKWDSDFFKMPVVKLEIDENEELEMYTLINYCKEKGIQLLYLFVDSNNFKVNQLLTKPVNTKIIYTANVLSVEGIKAHDNDLPILEMINAKTLKQMFPQILSLALEAGRFSRFRLDEKFTAVQFETMYKEWLLLFNRDSKKHKVYVIRFKNIEEIAGFIAYELLQDTYKIHFIAVSEKYQHQGLGKLMIKKAGTEAILNNINHVTVETQKDNIVACRFYEACGFQLTESVNIYHIHLQ